MTLVRGTLANFKYTKANQLNLVASLKCFRDGGKRSANGLFSVLLGDAALFGYGCDQFGFIHVLYPPDVLNGFCPPFIVSAFP